MESRGHRRPRGPVSRAPGTRPAPRPCRDVNDTSAGEDRPRQTPAATPWAEAWTWELEGPLRPARCPPRILRTDGHTGSLVTATWG